MMLNHFSILRPFEQPTLLSPMGVNRECPCLAVRIFRVFKKETLHFGKVTYWQAQMKQ